MKSRIATVLLATGLALGSTAGIPAAASPNTDDLRDHAGAASGSCYIAGYGPRIVDLGAVPLTKTFYISGSGCSDWTLEDSGTGSFFVYADSPQETFDANYLQNSYAGTSSVVATGYDADFNGTERTFANSFYLRRRVTVQSDSFNAAPEPVRRGGKVTIDARFLIVDWDAYPMRYVSFGGHSVSVQFRTSSGDYRTVKVVKTDSAGRIHTTATQSTSGVWRVTYGGYTLYSAATSTGDAVAVK